MDKNLATKIRENREDAGHDIKDSTLKIYVANIKKLSKKINDGVETGGATWLKDVKNVDTKLDKNDKGEALSYTTKRNYFNSIIIYLNALNSDKKYDDLIKEYSEFRDKLNKQYEDAQASNVFSESQSKNIATLDEIHKVITDIGNELKEKGIKTKGTLNLRERSLLQVYIILNIHLMIPLRNDLASTKIIQKREYNKMTDEDKNTTNFLVTEKTKYWFCLNDYKTSKVYKERCIEVPSDLKKVLRFYFRILNKKPNDYLLTQNDNETPMTRNGVSQLLTKTFKKRLGKSISTTLLRKIYLSHKYADVKDEMIKDAHAAGHSVATQQKYYTKKMPDTQAQTEEDKNSNTE